MSWPPNSSDINPIEYIWDVLGRQLRVQRPPIRNISDLCDRCLNIWYNLSPAICQGLVTSMPRRAEAVLYAKEAIFPKIYMDNVYDVKQTSLGTPYLQGKALFTSHPSWNCPCKLKSNLSPNLQQVLWTQLNKEIFQQEDLDLAPEGKV
ncbi:transposase domain containing protein [Trichonephila clavipes]|nr:transposase domain containing protein [Trichonephila clavipes]